MRWTLWLGTAAFAAYLAIIGVVYVSQDSLVYNPVLEVKTPAQFDLDGVEQVILIAADGTKQRSWWLAPQAGAPLVVAFAGNAGAPPVFREEFRLFRTRGWGLLAPAYRGYFGSEGKPGKQAILSDGVAWVGWARAAAPTAPITIWGASLGSGIGAEVAVTTAAHSLILEAPYTTSVEQGTNMYPWLPVQLLLRDRYDTRTNLAAFSGDVLIVHGEADTTIPVHMGRALLATCKARPGNARCEGYFPPNGNHNDLRAFGLIEHAVTFIAATTSSR